MAVDLTKYAGNSKRQTVAIVGDISTDLVGGMGKLTNGEVYVISNLPSGAVITSVDLSVIDTFAGDAETSTPTATVNIGSTAIFTDVDISTKATYRDNGANATLVTINDEADVTVKVTNINNAESGKFLVTIEFIDTNLAVGAFTR